MKHEYTIKIDKEFEDLLTKGVHDCHTALPPRLTVQDMIVKSLRDFLKIPE